MAVWLNAPYMMTATDLTGLMGLTGLMALTGFAELHKTGSWFTRSLFLAIRELGKSGY